MDGKRDPMSVEWWQYDYTNPELAAETAKKVLEKWDADPQMTNYSLAANDGWEEGWCECETCAAVGNATDQILTFANRVAEIMSEKYPDKTISILSYHNSFFPPEKVKAHPNVEVMFCRETSMTIPLDLGEEILGKKCDHPQHLHPVLAREFPGIYPKTGASACLHLGMVLHRGGKASVEGRPLGTGKRGYPQSCALETKRRGICLLRPGPCIVAS